ncbi:MAG: fibronectin type III domain-containing protein [Polyangiales bacterium]
MATSTALTASFGTVAQAAPPVFPDNIVVFPDRDFVTLEGFQDHVGETATVEVLRQGRIVGSAQGRVEPGDVAFEVNHPGGYCWGAGTGLNVTPDIVAGDVVQIRFGGAVVADTIVADAAVDGVPQLEGATVTITGHVRGGVNPTFLEQRVVNPDLTDTDVARRDIRAIVGPLTRAAKGGYSSALVVQNGVAIATYIFDSVVTAGIAARGGGERMMSWQEEDADGNRQGLTIAELGEPGGPGMGGCPNGPGQQQAPQPGAAAAVRSTDRTSIVVTWTAAVPVPGASVVTGYSVMAIANTATGGVQLQLGARTAASATSLTITGLTPAVDYSVEVRALAGTQLGSPLTIAVPSGGSGTPGTPNATFTAPVATLAANGVTLTSIANTEIYYTLDSTEPRVADMPSELALLYTGPIVITVTPTLLKFFAMDLDGKFSDTGEGSFNANAPQGPAAPSGISATAGDASATVRWLASAGTPAATAYRITATPRAPSTAAVVTQEAPGTATSLVITRLVNGVDYDITVAGLAGTVAGAASSPVVTVRPVASTIDRITIASAQWKAGDFRIAGTGTIAGANVTAHRVNADNTIGAAITGATSTVAAPAAAGGTGAYEIRVRNGAPATNPGRIYIRSDRGGVAGPFTVVNK